MKVAFIGDTHANLTRMREVFARASSAQVDTIIQTGDFGYWPNDQMGQQFLDQTSAEAVGRRITIHWIDGNHERHDLLPHDATEPFEVLPNLVWHPRGTSSTIGACKFLWMGGAVSIDKGYRTAGVNWFPQETPSRSQWDRAYAQKSTDVLVAHDGLPGVSFTRMYGFPISDELDRASKQMRRELSLLVAETEPSLYVHGHWHQRRTNQLGNVLVESLAHDLDYLENQMIFVELDSLIPAG